MLGAGAAVAALAWLRIAPARATPVEMAAAMRAIFGDVPIRSDRVRIEIPQIAENGNVVPITVTVESPMTPADHVQSIYLFAEENPLPHIVEMVLGPHNGRARVSTRIRLALSQHVVAIAKLSDGSLWSAAAEVEVTSAGCGG